MGTVSGDTEPHAAERFSIRRRDGNRRTGTTLELRNAGVSDRKGVRKGSVPEESKKRPAESAGLFSIAILAGFHGLRSMHPVKFGFASSDVGTGSWIVWPYVPPLK